MSAITDRITARIIGECEPRRREDGTPYCQMHGYSHYVGVFRFTSFPEGLVGWETPGPGWLCDHAAERSAFLAEAMELLP